MEMGVDRVGIRISTPSICHQKILATSVPAGRGVHPIGFMAIFMPLRRVFLDSCTSLVAARAVAVQSVPEFDRRPPRALNRLPVRLLLALRSQRGERKGAEDAKIVRFYS